MECDRPRLWVRRLEYPKYTIPSEPQLNLVQGEREPSLIPGGSFGFGIGAEVLFNKFCQKKPDTLFSAVVQPGDPRAVRYSQGLLAITCQHRISAGIGIVDVLPGIDMDFMAGGMFNDSQQLGDFTQTSLESYGIGLGLTWRFGRGVWATAPRPGSLNSSI